jgi:hypothetical protein
MTPLEIALATLQGLLASTGFLLALFVGFLLVAGLSKLRPRDQRSAAARNLSERLGTSARYLSPNAPRGPADQLHTPELLEQSANNS